MRPGVWRLRVYAGHGRYRSETFHGTEKQADKRLDRFRIEIEDEQPAKGTVAELMDRWLEVMSHELAPATLLGYRQYTANYIIPVLGKKGLGQARGRDIDAMYEDMLSGRISRSGKRLNPGTVRQVHAILRSAYQQAVKWEMVAVSPVRASTPPRLKPYEIEPPALEDISTALKLVFQRPTLYLFLRVAVMSGARRGEMCAIRWSEMNFETGVVSMRHSVINIPHHPLELKLTKNEKPKKIALDRRTVVLLKWHRRCQRVQAVRCGLDLAPDPFVFAGDVVGSKPWRPNQATTEWSRIRDRAGLEGVRLHDLRHALATRMLAAGDDLVTVANRLGHTDPATTLRIYAHWVPQKDREAADRLGDEFDDL